MKIYRQGDVLLTQTTTLPKTVKVKKDNVVAYGEVTGHSHRFDSKELLVTQLNGALYANIAFPTPLIHEEHNTLIIDPGLYKITGEREWDYFEKELRKVVD